MPFPRLHRDERELDTPPTFRLTDFARRSGGGSGKSGGSGGEGARRPHDAELAIERVQSCLDRLDELLEPLPFRRFEVEDEGPWAA